MTIREAYERWCDQHASEIHPPGMVGYCYCEAPRLAWLAAVDYVITEMVIRLQEINNEVKSEDKT